MGGRARPNWVVFQGGPLDGQRHLLPPTTAPGPLKVNGSTGRVGWVAIYLYDLRPELRPREFDGGMERGRARTAVFVRRLEDEPAGPSTPPSAVARVGIAPWSSGGVLA